MRPETLANVAVHIARYGLPVVVLVALVLLGWGGERYANVVPDASRITVWLGAFWVVVFPAGWAIGEYLQRHFQPAGYPDEGLPRAGLHIGRLERILTLIFYVGNSLTAIALLATLKSIYRFGALSKQAPGETSEYEDTFSISEYVILGSLMSYTVAIVIGIAGDYALRFLPA